MIDKLLMRKFYDKLLNAGREMAWNICIGEQVQSKRNCDSYKYHIIDNPFHYWIADPFLQIENGKTYIFAEGFNLITRKGEILLYDVNKKKWTVVIRENKHMSFPYVFYENGKYYMIPETEGKNGVYLYRATCFPYKWIIEKEIVHDRPLCDSVFVDYEDGRILISYNCHTVPNQLEIFDVDKNWNTSMRCIIKDYDNALRPAGAVQTINGECYLYTQDCSKQYGGGIIKNTLLVSDSSTIKIVPINKTDVSRVIKSEEYIGIHTFNTSDNGLAVIDIKSKRFSFRFLCKKIFKKIFQCHNITLM